MNTDDTLNTLIGVVKRGPGERALLCPECDSPNVTAKAGHALPYVCPDCLSEFGTLGELAVKS